MGFYSATRPYVGSSPAQANVANFRMFGSIENISQCPKPSHRCYVGGEILRLPITCVTESQNRGVGRGT